MWYQRPISIPSDWEGKKIILHFGAVDYYAEVFIDGHYVGSHYGGSSSFSMDVTPAVKAGQKHNLVVYVTDDAPVMGFKLSVSNLPGYLLMDVSTPVSQVFGKPYGWKLFLTMV